MRRILLVMSVAALMVAMIVASAVPVFAAENNAGKSLDNRNEQSLQPNYGGFRSDEQGPMTNEANPNPNNTSGVARRTVGKEEGEGNFFRSTEYSGCLTPEEDCRLGPGKGSQR